MSASTVRVGKKIKFGPQANRKDNVEGNLCLEKVTFVDDFLVDPSENDWVEGESNGGTIAYAAANGGTITLTTGATTEDNAELGHGIQWSAAKNAVIETRLKVDDITTVGICAGFSDAVEEGDDKMAFEISGTTIVDRATNGACWVFDTDADNDYWHYCNTKAGTQAGTAHGTTAPVNDTYVVLRVELDSDGGATFYYNGDAVGYKASAVTAATLLTPYIAVIARTTAARVVTADYVKCWQDR